MALDPVFVLCSTVLQKKSAMEYVLPLAPCC
jgi:hypothetical protein